MDSKNAKAFYRRGRARQVLGQDDDARSDLLNALKNARTYWAFPKSRHTVYCPSVTVIKRKYTTGNSYQYSRLLQIYHKRTVRPDYARLFAHTHYEVHPYLIPITKDSRLTLFFYICRRRNAVAETKQCRGHRELGFGKHHHQGAGVVSVQRPRHGVDQNGQAKVGGRTGREH